MLTVHLTTTDTSEEHRNVAAVRCATPGGPIKILPHHAPMLSALNAGRVYLVMASGGIQAKKVTSPGLLKVEKDTVTIVS